MPLFKTVGSLLLKKKLMFHHDAERVLVHVPMIGLFFFILLKFLFPKDFGPVDSEFLGISGGFVSFVWMVELGIVNCLRKAIEEGGAHAFFEWVWYRFVAQLFEVLWFGWGCDKDSYHMTSVYVFKFVSLAFFVALTPYRLYLFELLRRFRCARMVEKRKINEMI